MTYLIADEHKCSSAKSAAENLSSEGETHTGMKSSSPAKDVQKPGSLERMSSPIGFDRKAYQKQYMREYMRKRRASKKAAIDE